MGSHEDYQCKLINNHVQTNTSNNNLHNLSQLSANWSDISECSVLSSSSLSNAEFCGASRRKYTTFSKGITIEEFLETQTTWQPSAIDKLLIKNKAALAESQMKQTKPKPTKQATSTKKENCARKPKVISSKVAEVKKKTALGAQSEKRPPPVKAIAGGAAAKPPKDGTETVQVNGVEKKPKASSKVAQSAKTQPGGAVVKSTKNRTVSGKRGQEKEGAKKPPRKVVPADGKKKVTKSDKGVVVKTGSKVRVRVRVRKPVNVVGKVEKTKRSGKTKAALYETRGSREKLRNGKTRILKEKNQSVPSAKRRSGKKIEGDSAEGVSSVVGKLKCKSPLTPKQSESPGATSNSKSGRSASTFKRVHIKEEPLEEASQAKRRRRRTENINARQNAPEDSELNIKPFINSSGELVDGNKQPDTTSNNTTMKDEFDKSIKEEKTEPENVIEEINVINKELINTENIYVYGSINSETSSLIPNGYILQDLGAFVKEMEMKSAEKMDDKLTTVVEPVPTVRDDERMTEVELEDLESEEFQLHLEEVDADDDLTEESINLQIEKESSDMDEVVEIIESITEHETVIIEESSTEAEDTVESVLVNVDDDETVHISDDESIHMELDEPMVIGEDSDQTNAAQLAKQEPESNKKAVSTVNGQEEDAAGTDLVEGLADEEDSSVKESILNALGLQSLEKVHQKTKDKEKDNYTGTLKAVIKTDKGCRRMEMKQKENLINVEGLQNETVLSFYSKTIQIGSKLEDDNMNTLSTNIEKSNDNSSKMDAWFMEEDSTKMTKTHDDVILSEPVAGVVPAGDLVIAEDSQLTKDKSKAAASLVVPEKSSSFSIHPNRLCSDVCKYCFGKFGSLDTPCHVGQLKNQERQRKILLCEPNLKIDTCLCDACYRYVDRKANKPPTKRNKTIRRSSLSINQRAVCAIQNCNQFARHSVKRKWLMRISKKIAKLSFDVNKRGPRMMYGLCSQHYYLIDFYTLCGICKKRLDRNHMYSISQINVMNQILAEDTIPVKLVDNMLLCKLCHYYMSIRERYGGVSEMSTSNRQYYLNFKKKVLMYYNVVASDSEDTNSSEGMKSQNGDNSSPERMTKPKKIEDHKACEQKEQSPTDPEKKAPSSSKKSHNVGIHDIASLLKPLEGDGDKSSTRIQVKFGNLNIGKLSNLNIGQNTSTDLKHEKSSDRELPLIADFSFDNSSSSQRNWEKCVSTIQFDKGTKKLWQDLQKPYGNQSSFIRHLIMLEKYWRSGALVLSECADPAAVKYINSVKNRISSLETFSTATTMTTTYAQQSTSKTQCSTSSSCSSTSAPPGLVPVSATTSKPAAAVTESTGISGPAPAPPRHSAEPPPLLKLTNIANSYMMIPKTSSSEFGTQPLKGVITSTGTNVFVHNDTKTQVSLNQYKEMMHPQPRTKQLMQVGSANSHMVSLLKKPPSLSPVTSSVPMRIAQQTRQMAVPAPKNVTSNIRMSNGNFIARPPTKAPNMDYPSLKPIGNSLMKCENYGNSSLIIAKLPKALTVTQVDEPMKEKVEEKPLPISSPFLAGEKPSISVFREISK